MLLEQADLASEQRRPRQVLDVVTRLGQAQADPEFGALFRNAVDPDFAAHLLDQSLGNHQTEPRTARLARERIVRLTERLEQRTQVLISQTDAGVLHADAQLSAVGALVFDHRPDDDGAFIGELDGIADQIGQHLFESQRVADQ